MPFQKGHEGFGQKRTHSVRAQALSRFAHYGGKTSKELDKIDLKNVPSWDEIVFNWVKRARHDQKAAVELAAYYVGKPVQPLSGVDDEEGPPIKQVITVRFALPGELDE